MRVNASALTPDSNSSDPEQLPWYLSHLKYPWLSNSFLFLGLLFLAVELPLLVVSDCKLERAFQMNSDMAKLTNPIQIKILNEMIQTQLASAEELFKVYCGLETIGNFIVTVLSAYYLFYHFHSESFRIFGVPAVTAWVVTHTT